MRCLFGLHKWGKWVLLEEGIKTARDTSQSWVSGRFYLQERRCLSCDRIERDLKIVEC